MSDVIHDVIMIGAGPSALTAAIYTTREDIETVLYEKAVVGGLAAITDKIDNYPGFADGIEGFALTDQMRKQAENFGAKIEVGDVIAIRDNGDNKIVVVDGNELKAKAVLISTGSNYNKLGIPGESEYYGRGVSYCATCDGAFYRGKKLAVIGGGNSAVQEAIFLTRFSSHIDLLVRSTVKASEVLQRELQKNVDEGKITVHVGTVTDEIIVTDNRVSSVRVTKDNKPEVIEVDGVFVFAGLRPNTQFLDGSGIELDEMGFVKTNLHLQTNIPGIFASGDVRSGATMQVASAVGEGATAAQSIREYLEELKQII
jgi:thioredoxin reductase (NADPH)